MTAATATAEMPAACAASATAPAGTHALAAPRRSLGAVGALGLLTHAVTVAGIAQRVAAVVGAGTVTRRRGIRPLTLGRRLAVGRRGLAIGRGRTTISGRRPAVRPRVAGGTRRTGAGAALPQAVAATRFGVAGNGLAGAALE